MGGGGVGRRLTGLLEVERKLDGFDGISSHFTQRVTAVNFQDDQSRDDTHLCFRRQSALSSHVIHWLPSKRFSYDTRSFLSDTIVRGPGAGSGSKGTKKKQRPQLGFDAWLSQAHYPYPPIASSPISSSSFHLCIALPCAYRSDLVRQQIVSASTSTARCIYSSSAAPPWLVRSHSAVS